MSAENKKCLEIEEVRMFKERLEYLTNALFFFCKNGYYPSDEWIFGMESMGIREKLQKVKIHFYTDISLTLLVEGNRPYTREDCFLAVRKAFFYMSFRDLLKAGNIWN